MSTRSSICNKTRISQILQKDRYLSVSYSNFHTLYYFCFSESKKVKEKLESCEQVILQQKESSKQTILKLAVYEQKEKKHQQEIKDWTDERNRIEGQLQRERGLNIQSSQQISVIFPEFLFPSACELLIIFRLVDLL